MYAFAKNYIGDEVELDCISEPPPLPIYKPRGRFHDIYGASNYLDLWDGCTYNSGVH